MKTETYDNILGNIEDNGLEYIIELKKEEIRNLLIESTNEKFYYYGKAKLQSKVDEIIFELLNDIEGLTESLIFRKIFRKKHIYKATLKHIYKTTLEGLQA